MTSVCSLYTGSLAVEIKKKNIVRVFIPNLLRYMTTLKVKI